MSAFPQFNRLKKCRYGLMVYNVNDLYIGRSLEEYGEWSEGEIDLFRHFVRPGQVVLEVGANIGAHTVWLAQAVGYTGMVLAFEPQRIVFQTLCANLALNSITNVHCFCSAVGNVEGQIVVPRLDYCQTNNFGGLTLGSYAPGETVPLVTIDGLKLKKCHLLKIDVEGMELEVLQGAVNSIAALAPILYVENDRQTQAESLIHLIDALGYNMYSHMPVLYNPHNFAGNCENVFSKLASLNLLCIPKKFPQQIQGLPLVEPANATLRA